MSTTLKDALTGLVWAAVLLAAIINVIQDFA